MGEVDAQVVDVDAVVEDAVVLHLLITRGHRVAQGLASRGSWSHTEGALSRSSRQFLRDSRK